MILTKRQRAVLSAMAADLDGDAGELVYERGRGYLGDEPVAARTVFALLRLCAISLRGGEIGGLERYRISSTGRALLGEDGMTADVFCGCKTAVQTGTINGFACQWHRERNQAALDAARAEVERLRSQVDRRVDAELRAAGIHPLRLWESDVTADLSGCVGRVETALAHGEARAQRFTSIEMFTGAGGLALGLAEAGFDHLAIIEWDKHACASIRRNQRALPHVAFWPLYEMDVRRFDFKPYAERTSLLAAGVPCQPFSLAGKHAGSRDDRNMFPEVMRAVRELRPRMVLVENVKGLLRPGFRPYFEYILLQLEMPDTGLDEGEAWESHKARLLRERDSGRSYGVRYDTTAQLINCADYGVPQVRERVFFVAVRRDLGIRWSPLVPTHSADALLYAQWVDGSYWQEHGLPVPKIIPAELRNRVRALALTGRPITARWRTVRDALRGLPVPAWGQEDPEYTNHVGNPGARAYPGHDGSPYYWPAKTLKAGVHGVPGGENMLRHANGRVRYFTAREAARVQTFPDAYRFSGAWGECMRQVGNAVPVRVGGIIGAAARAALARVTSGADTTRPTEPTGRPSARSRASDRQTRSGSTSADSGR